MNDKLTTDQNWVLNHWSMWGSDGYPVEKIRNSWQVRGQRGLGACPHSFKTKREAVAQWEIYIAILLDYAGGRVDNPALHLA